MADAFRKIPAGGYGYLRSQGRQRVCRALRIPMSNSSCLLSPANGSRENARPPSRGMTTEKTRLRILAARSARSDAVCDALENEEGAGKAGCPQHPRSCAKVHTGDRKVRRNTRPSLRNGFTA